MKKTVTSLAWFIAVAVAAVCFAGGPLSLDSLPPVVVRSVPVSGDLPAYPAPLLPE